VRSSSSGNCAIFCNNVVQSSNSTYSLSGRPDWIIQARVVQILMLLYVPDAFVQGLL
jgi:hypothetical protein